MKANTIRLSSTLALAASLFLAAESHGDSIVVPSSDENSEASINNVFPFDITASVAGDGGQRYQQVYDASEFGDSPMVIEQILFRLDQAFGTPFDTVLPSVQINLSTTPRPVDGLSATFADNVGADDTVVRPAGPLALSSTAPPGPGGSFGFDIVVNLLTPYLYDPSGGNLLLEVRNFLGGVTNPFDASDASDDTTSRVFSSVQGANAVSGSPDSWGLVTSFTVRPVPEPASLALLLLAPLAAPRRRRA